MPNSIHNLTPHDYRLAAIDVLFGIFAQATSAVEQMFLKVDEAGTEAEKADASRECFSKLGRCLAAGIDSYAVARKNLTEASAV